MSAVGTPLRLISHSQKVCSLYKRALRNLEAFHDRREVFRYHAVLLRQRFEDNRNLQDMRVACELLVKGEQELYENEHYQPRKFPESPGGVAYQREEVTPDWVLDYWHPLEKARYPDYFARREERKKQFIEMWEKKYGKPSKEDLHH